MAPPSRAFKHLLLWLIAGTRGGENRGRIVVTLRDEPMNTNQLSNHLELDYRTVKHHLDVLEENGLVSTIGDGYGKMYYVSSRLEENMELFEEIWGNKEENKPE
jgi:DNA-binding transcriptional ArsR family regulator